MRKLFLSFAILGSVVSAKVSAQDQLLDIMKDEVKNQFTQLKKQNENCYYINFRVEDRTSNNIASSFGEIVRNVSTRTRVFVPQFRIGTPQFDNFKYTDMGEKMLMNRQYPYVLLPVDGKDEGKGVREAIWQHCNSRFNTAGSMLTAQRSKQVVSVETEDKAPCFVSAPVVSYFEESLPESQRKLDQKKWEEYTNKVSSVFKKYPKIVTGVCGISYTVERRYVVNSEGTAVAQNLRYARLMVNGMAKADDGMLLPLNLSYFAFDPNNLPAVDQVMSDADDLAKRILALVEAPVADPFSGPAILSGAASGVFFHEIFGHRIEGQRMRRDNDGQTFKKMVGKYILPADMQVYDDASLKQYNGSDLNGYYAYDDQGVKSERVDVIVNGKMNHFLMTRSPIDVQTKSNGHARAAFGADPISRQGNLIIESTAPKTDKQLRELLIAEAKKQGKEYGYFFKEVTGGFTNTSTFMPNSFNVTPLEVYKIYVDGRPDQLVRGVNMIGTPLSMFSNIAYCGDKQSSRIFTGICGAESGQIPVTAISPSIMVRVVETQRQAKDDVIQPILPRPSATANNQSK